VTGPTDQGLPWERASGAPSGVGICLSGGGLRAAAFANGVVQALDEERRLMHGSEAAQYLSAVSGGSYLAAALAVNAHALAGAGDEAPAPLAARSQEQEYLLDHATVLTRSMPIVARFALLWILNLAAFLAFFLWLGAMLLAFATAGEEFAPASMLSVLDDAPPAFAFVVLAAATYAALFALYQNFGPRTFALWFASLCVVAVSGEAVFNVGLDRVDGRQWWELIALLAVGIGLSAGATVVLKASQTVGWPARLANGAGTACVRASGAVLMFVSADLCQNWFAAGLEDPQVDQVKDLVIFLALLFGGLLFSYVPDRASLHREYREHVRTVFGKTRAPDAPGGVVDGERHFLLSQLAGVPGFPRLLISATVNVARPATGPGWRPKYSPFVLSHDVSGIPGSDCHFRTAQLELGRVPGALLPGTKEPLVTLFTAVAANGAAASPSMGRYTIPSLRPLFALADIRLGRWLPNPTNARQRALVEAKTEPGRFDKRNRLGPGWDELISDVLGITGQSAYVSDGGHYDNLGLMTLLRARCAEIWCVDSAPDEKGSAGEIRRVLELARSELGCANDVDPDVFKADSSGVYKRAWTAGTVTYADGSACRLRIVKLGLASESADPLKAYRQSDPGFPHHSTGILAYPRVRMEAYRDLGRDSTQAAVEGTRANEAQQG
jgi:hypothetical protein